MQAARELFSLRASHCTRSWLTWPLLHLNSPHLGSGCLVLLVLSSLQLSAMRFVSVASTETAYRVVVMDTELFSAQVFTPTWCEGCTLAPLFSSSLYYCLVGTFVLLRALLSWSFSEARSRLGPGGMCGNSSLPWACPFCMTLLQGNNGLWSPGLYRRGHNRRVVVLVTQKDHAS